eukprot:COSAG06_NODE_642_length_13482_cov_21.927296_12_plen_158_part_00
MRAAAGAAAAAAGAAAADEAGAGADGGCGSSSGSGSGRGGADDVQMAAQPPAVPTASATAHACGAMLPRSAVCKKLAQFVFRRAFIFSANMHMRRRPRAIMSGNQGKSRRDDGRPRSMRAGRVRGPVKVSRGPDSVAHSVAQRTPLLAGWLLACLAQ